MNYARTALITGITGQDGSYLAEFLLSKGYEVHGIVRRSSLINTHRIDPFYSKIKLHYGDMTDSGSIIHIIQKVKPQEIYNLAVDRVDTMSINKRTSSYNTVYIIPFRQ